MIKDKKVEITKKDYLTFKYFAFLYDLPALITILWVTTLSAVVLTDYFMTRRSFLIALLAIFMVSSYINSIFFKLPRTTKQEYSTRAFPNPKFAVSFTKDTLSIMREGSTPSDIKLENLYTAFETFAQFSFFISKNNYLIVPKNLLTDEEVNFIRGAIKTLPHNKRKNPFSSGVKNTLKTFFMLAFITLCALILILSYKMT